MGLGNGLSKKGPTQIVNIRPGISPGCASKKISRSVRLQRCGKSVVSWRSVRANEVERITSAVPFTEKEAIKEMLPTTTRSSVVVCLALLLGLTLGIVELLTVGNIA